MAYLLLLCNVVKDALGAGFVNTTTDIDFASPPPVQIDEDGTVTAQAGPNVLITFADDCCIVASDADELRLALQAMSWGLHRLRCRLSMPKTWQLVNCMRQRAQYWWHVVEHRDALMPVAVGEI